MVRVEATLALTYQWEDLWDEKPQSHHAVVGERDRRKQRQRPLHGRAIKEPNRARKPSRRSS